MGLGEESDSRAGGVQETAKSLEGSFGNGARDAGWKMVQRGIVQFVASGGHNPEYRPTRMDAAFDLVNLRGPGVNKGFVLVAVEKRL